MATFDQLDELARSLPEVSVRPGRDGRPRYYVKAKFFGAHRDPRPDALDEGGARLDDVIVFRVADEGVKQALLAERPEIYFTTGHFTGYPAILTRIAWLSHMSDEELHELVVEAWLTQAPTRLAQRYLEDSGLLVTFRGAWSRRRGSFATVRHRTPGRRS